MLIFADVYSFRRRRRFLLLRHAATLIFADDYAATLLMIFALLFFYAAAITIMLYAFSLYFFFHAFAYDATLRCFHTPPPLDDALPMPIPLSPMIISPHADDFDARR